METLFLVSISKCGAENKCWLIHLSQKISFKQKQKMSCAHKLANLNGSNQAYLSKQQ